MNHYNYTKDKELAEQCEYEVACAICEKYGCDFVRYNHDNKYDILFYTKKGTYLKVEVKQDFTCARTGNVGAEVRLQAFKLQRLTCTASRYTNRKIRQASILFLQKNLRI